MLRIRTLLPVLLSIFAATLSAQEISVRSGTQIPVELRTTIKAESSKVGDAIEFRTTEAVLIGNNIVVPEGAKITGRIEQVTRSANPPNSVVHVSITALQWKKGEAPLNAVIISVEPTPAQQMLNLGRHHRFRDPPTFLNHIHIRAHLLRHAVTEFYSDQPNFSLHSGLYFLLRQINSDRDPALVDKDHILNVGPQD